MWSKKNKSARASKAWNKQVFGQSSQSPSRVKQSFSSSHHVQSSEKKVQKKTWKNPIQWITTRLLFAKLWIPKQKYLTKLSIAFSRIILVVGVITLLISWYVDTFFLVKHIAIRLNTNSYLDTKTAEHLIKSIQQERLFYTAPLNSFLYINSDWLTHLGNTTSDHITSVDVIHREWPDSVELLVTTTPAIATLRYDEKNLVISADGSVLGVDESYIKNNSIALNTMTVPEQFLTTQVLKNNPTLFNKIKYATYLKNYLNTLGYTLSYVGISSDFYLDPDILVATNTGTTILFSLPINTQLEKHLATTSSVLEQYLSPNTPLAQSINLGDINYVDLRFSNTAYVCKRSAPCSPDVTQ